MIREQQTLRQVGLFCLVGIGLLGIALFTPDAAQAHGTNFFAAARKTSWHHALDWESAWCSLKIILLSLGLFLIVDSLGTLLVKLKYRIMAGLVFLLHLFPCLGVLAGSFYLLKSLL